MPRNFLSCDRDQPLLLPPDLRDWLPEDHLAWFVIESVESLDLQAFDAAYRADGHGAAAHDPRMMVALLFYAYSTGERSSRQIERHLREDVAYRVVAANRVPDHSTISRFRSRHEAPLGDLFTQVLGLCVEAGIGSPAVVAVDGTKVAADASGHANADHEAVARGIIEEAGRIDAAEDETYGDRRGDELPAELSTRRGRQEWIREALRRQKEEREADPEPVPRGRAERLEACRRRLEDEHRTVVAAHLDYDARRAAAPRGRRPVPAEPPAGPEGKVNTTDPDSRPMRSAKGFLQGYNAQVLTNASQVVIAAEVLTDANDSGALAPMMELAVTELDGAGSTETPGVVLADAGYWSTDQIDRVRERQAVPLVPPDRRAARGAPDPGEGTGPPGFMRRALRTPTGQGLHRRRKWMVEPVFAQIKVNRGVGRFRRRGLGAVRSEWRLLTATHNLLKLHRHRLALAAAG
jgi:transposase